MMRGILLMLLCLVPLMAAEVPDLKEAPLVKRLWLGVEQGVIRPASYEQIRSEDKQRVAIHFPDGAELKKGQHWATIAPLNLEIERRKHNLDQIKGRHKLDKELADFEEERIRMTIAREEAAANAQALQLASQDESLAVELREHSKRAAVKLQQKAELLDKQLTPEALEQKRELLREEHALQRDRDRKQLEELEMRSVIRASCDGSLVLGDELASELLKTEADEDGKKVVWVGSKQLIGVVRNDDHHELWVDAEGPLLANLPLDQIGIRVQQPRSGALILAEHKRTEEYENGNEIRRTYVFRIAAEGADAARDSFGVRCMAHVYVNFNKPYRMVFKKDIAHLDPTRLEAGGWSGLIQHLWPGSKVIQVGPQTIAVQPADED